MNSDSNQNNTPDNIPSDKILILFDGYCNLCNGAVQFILKRDKKEKFLFAGLSWEIGEKLISQFPELEGADSIVVYRDGKVYKHSKAALIIAQNLGGFWPVTGVFRVVPPFIRDAIYRWVAKNRYRWFGQKDTCMMPEKDVSHRFLK